MSTDKPRRLGRGLEALLAGRPAAGDRGDDREIAPRNALRSIPVAQVRPNPHQPRKEFGAAELGDLESSIRVNGLLQPITVRADSTGSEFFLIAGERRFRAVQRLGWREIPAIVREHSEIDDKMLLRQQAIIGSMTRAERKNTKLLNGSRRRRIALGSGTDVADVNRLLKQFLQMQEMMKKMQKMGKKGFMRSLAGKLPPGMMPPGGLR